MRTIAVSLVNVAMTVGTVFAFTHACAASDAREMVVRIQLNKRITLEVPKSVVQAQPEYFAGIAANTNRTTHAARANRALPSAREVRARARQHEIAKIVEEQRAHHQPPTTTNDLLATRERASNRSSEECEEASLPDHGESVGLERRCRPLNLTHPRTSTTPRARGTVSTNAICTTHVSKRTR